MCSARAVIMNTHAISSNRQTDTKSVLKSADTIVHGSSISAFRMSKSSSYQRDTDKISGHKSITSHLIEVSQAVISAASACHERTGTSEAKLCVG